MEHYLKSNITFPVKIAHSEPRFSCHAEGRKQTPPHSDLNRLLLQITVASPVWPWIICNAKAADRLLGLTREYTSQGQIMFRIKVSFAVLFRTSMCGMDIFRRVLLQRKGCMQHTNLDWQKIRCCAIGNLSRELQILFSKTFSRRRMSIGWSTCFRKSSIKRFTIMLLMAFPTQLQRDPSQWKKNDCVCFDTHYCSSLNVCCLSYFCVWR